MLNYDSSRWIILPVSILAAMAMIVMALSSAQAQDDTLYVDGQNGADSSSCGGLDAPCRSIQQAVNNADSGALVLVAAGEYRFPHAENYCEQYFDGLQAVVCIINKRVEIRGGYASGRWDTPASGPSGTVIDGEERYRAVYAASSDPNKPGTAGLSMFNFTIRNGFTAGKNSGGDTKTFAFGGGILTDFAYLSLGDMAFEGNSARGGNTTTSHGGAASGGALAIRRSPGTATLQNITFSGNLAAGGSGAVRGGLAQGGALFVYQSQVSGTDLVFRQNTAHAGSSNGSGRDGGETADAVGGAAIVQIGSAAVFSRVLAEYNQTIGGDAGGKAGGAFGGAIGGEGMPWLAGQSTSLTIQDSVFRHNLAQGGNGVEGGMAAGGAIETFHTETRVLRNTIVANDSFGGDGSGEQGPAGGGGVYFQNIYNGQSTVACSNNVIADNQVAAGQGGAVGGGGGAIWLQGIKASVDHNTIVGNRLLTEPMQGSAILVMSDGVVPGPQPTMLRYNIIAGHNTPGSAALHVKPSNSAVLDANLFVDNLFKYNESQVGAIEGKETTIDASSAGFIAGDAPEYDFHITSSSPATNRATASTETVDRDGIARSGIPDIGAYEAKPFTVRVFPLSSQALRAEWGQNPGVNHYEMSIRCNGGAAAPNEISCNSPAYYPGSEVGVTLTGLTNFVAYDVAISAIGDDGKVMFSATVEAMPTDRFLYLPAVLRP